MQFLVDFGPFVIIALFSSLERIAPARVFPRLRRWRSRGVLSFLLYLGLATWVPMAVDGWLGRYQLFDVSHWGLVPGVAVGVLALELVSYAWHRALHRVPFLWRWFHQMHHSAERLDVFGAFLFHPFDAAAFVLMGSVSLVLLVGVAPEAAVIANLIVFAAVVLGHTNIRTPRWLGYIVQRPENHAVHHQRGVHAHNYADLSIIDVVFGTFKNPATWDGQAGFYDGASGRVRDMLRGRDISSAPSGEGAPGDSAVESWLDRELQPGS